GRPHSLVEMLRASVDRAANDVALVEVGADRLTYRELWDRASRIAGGLRREGVSRGDRVAIRLPNGIDWCVALFAVEMAGAIAVPVNTRLTDAEAGEIVRDSGSQFAFLPGDDMPAGTPLVVEHLTPRDVAARIRFEWRSHLGHV